MVAMVLPGQPNGAMPVAGLSNAVAARSAVGGTAIWLWSKIPPSTLGRGLQAAALTVVVVAVVRPSTLAGAWAPIWAVTPGGVECSTLVIFRSA